MRAALLRQQACRGRLEHHAHRRGDRLEPLDLLPGHHPGFRCGSSPVSSRTRIAIGPQVIDRGVIAVRIQPVPGRRPAVLRPVAEGEQGLLAAQRRALRGRSSRTSSGDRKAPCRPCQLPGVVTKVQ